MIRDILAGVLLLDAAVVGTVGYFWHRKRRNKLENWNLVSGEVVEIKRNIGRNGPTRRLVIRYRTPQGKDEICESKYGPIGKVEVGEQMEIMVDPSDPSRGEVMNSISPWVPLVYAAGALASIVAAVIVWLVMKV